MQLDEALRMVGVQYAVVWLDQRAVFFGTADGMYMPPAARQCITAAPTCAPDLPVGGVAAPASNHSVEQRALARRPSTVDARLFQQHDAGTMIGLVMSAYMYAWHCCGR